MITRCVSSLVLVVALAVHASAQSLTVNKHPSSAPVNLGERVTLHVTSTTPFLPGEKYRLYINDTTASASNVWIVGSELEAEIALEEPTVHAGSNQVKVQRGDGAGGIEIGTILIGSRVPFISSFAPSTLSRQEGPQNVRVHGANLGSVTCIEITALSIRSLSFTAIDESQGILSVETPAVSRGSESAIRFILVHPFDGGTGVTSEWRTSIYQALPVVAAPRARAELRPTRGEIYADDLTRSASIAFAVRSINAEQLARQSVDLFVDTVRALSDMTFEPGAEQVIDIPSTALRRTIRTSTRDSRLVCEFRAAGSNVVVCRGELEVLAPPIIDSVALETVARTIDPYQLEDLRSVGVTVFGRNLHRIDSLAIVEDPDGALFSVRIGAANSIGTRLAATLARAGAAMPAYRTYGLRAYRRTPDAAARRFYDRSPAFRVVQPYSPVSAREPGYVTLRQHASDSAATGMVLQEVDRRGDVVLVLDGDALRPSAGVQVTHYRVALKDSLGRTLEYYDGVDSVGNRLGGFGAAPIAVRRLRRDGGRWSDRWTVIEVSAWNQGTRDTVTLSLAQPGRWWDQFEFRPFLPPFMIGLSLGGSETHEMPVLLGTAGVGVRWRWFEGLIEGPFSVGVYLLGTPLAQDASAGTQDTIVRDTRIETTTQRGDFFVMALGEFSIAHYSSLAPVALQAGLAVNLAPEGRKNSLFLVLGLGVQL